MFFNILHRYRPSPGGSRRARPGRPRCYAGRVKPGGGAPPNAARAEPRGAGSPAERAPRRARRLRAALLLLLSPWYAWDLGSDRLTHGDEAYWTAAAWRTTSLLLAGDLGEAWRQGAITRTPKLGLYLIGAPLHGLGAPPPRFAAYDFYRSPQWNRERGLLPDPAALRAARLPGALLGVLACLWLFELLRPVTGPGWAFAGALLLGLDPLAHLSCRRAMLDAPAFAFGVAAARFTSAACARPERWAPVLLAGAAAGAATASKLNAALAVALLGLALGLEAARARSALPLRRAALAGALALALFVATDPSLYRAPVAGIVARLELGGELQEQLERLAAPYPGHALRSVPERARAGFEVLLLRRGPVGAWLGVPLDPPLLLAGLATLLARARRCASARVLLLWLATSVLGVLLWTPVRWERYFLPALAPLVAIECSGLALGSAWLAARLRRARAAA